MVKVRKRTDFSKIPECDVLREYIKWRHEKGLYTLLLATGLPGTGKSSECQRLAELIAQDIHGNNNIKETNIVDSMLGFLEFIRNVKGPGEICIIEEVSVLFPSRRSMSKSNVDMNKILDTCRKKQIIVLTNAPLYTSVDTHIRAMGHVLTETIEVNKTQGVVIFKAWRLQTNPHTGITYRHRFKRRGRDVFRYFTRKPNSDVWKKYELKKDEFMNNLYEKLKNNAKDEEEKQLKRLDKKVDIDLSSLNELQIKVYMMRHVQKKRRSDIAESLGLKPGEITTILEDIMSKTEKKIEE